MKKVKLYKVIKLSILAIMLYYIAGYIEGRIKFQSTVKDLNEFNRIKETWADIDLSDYKTGAGPGRDRVFFDTPHVLVIYGMLDKEKQDEVIDMVRKAKKKVPSSIPIRIIFYLKSNWIETKGPNGETIIGPYGIVSGIRGEEKVIRTEKIKQ